jgi:RHS repeat-associated protein
VEDWSSNVSQFSYNADGHLTGITYPNDTTAAIGYNAADQLTSITHSSGGTPFLSLSYTRDPVGVLSIANEGGRGSHGYEYDALYRLTGDGLGTGTTISNTWGYDAATQIVQTSYQVGAGTPITTVRTYDAANQLVSLSEKEGSTSLKKITFTFDDNGNRTRQYDSVPKQPTNYVYDAANRLIEFNQDDDGISYTVYNYNGDGLRVAKNNCAGPCYYTGYIWDVGVEAGLPLLLQDGEASYIYGPGGMILEEVTGGKEYYYHHDQLGSVRSLTDSSGSEVDTYDYDAYGNKLASSTSSTDNPFGYTGEYTDSESGMLYLRARYYDPATQQFLTKDSLVAWTEQAYAYVAGSPTYFTDPSGHCPMCIVVVPPVAGAAVAVAEGILFVGTAITTGLLGALGLNMLGNGSGSSCAINYTYSTPLVDPYPVDSSGNVLIGASTPAGSNTIGIRSPLELIPTTVYAEIDVDIEDPGAT